MNMIIDRTPPSRIAHYMSTRIPSVDIDATLKEAGGLLDRWQVSCLLVRNGPRYVGTVTDADLSRKAVAKGLDPLSTTVNTCMTKPLISVDETEQMSVAIDLMKEHGLRHLGVTKAETVIGILSTSGAVRYYAEMLPVLQDLAYQQH
jgi:CBS domain-containing protein